MSEQEKAAQAVQSRAAFESVLDSLYEIWDEAPMFGQWDPQQDGIYYWQFTKLSTGVMKTDNTPWFRLGGHIVMAEDPELENHDWSPFFFTGKFFGFVKEFCNTVYGDVPKTAKHAFHILEALQGTVVAVQVETVTTKKGREVRNKRALSAKLPEGLKFPTE